MKHVQYNCHKGQKTYDQVLNENPINKERERLKQFLIMLWNLLHSISIYNLHDFIGIFRRYRQQIKKIKEFALLFIQNDPEKEKIIHTRDIDKANTDELNLTLNVLIFYFEKDFIKHMKENPEYFSITTKTIYKEILKILGYSYESLLQENDHKQDVLISQNQSPIQIDEELKTSDDQNQSLSQSNQELWTSNIQVQSPIQSNEQLDDSIIQNQNLEQSDEALWTSNIQVQSPIQSNEQLDDSIIQNQNLEQSDEVLLTPDFQIQFPMQSNESSTIYAEDIQLLTDDEEVILRDDDFNENVSF